MKLSKYLSYIICITTTFAFLACNVTDTNSSATLSSTIHGSWVWNRSYLELQPDTQRTAQQTVHKLEFIFQDSTCEVISGDTLKHTYPYFFKMIYDSYHYVPENDSILALCIGEFHNNQFIGEVKMVKFLNQDSLGFCLAASERSVDVFHRKINP